MAHWRNWWAVFITGGDVCAVDLCSNLSAGNTRMKPYVRCFRVIIAIAAFSQIAISQQQTGTIIVFRLSPDHAVIAGDSRTVRMCPPKQRIVSQDVCKVLAFENKYAFAAVGYTARFDPCTSNHTLWNVRDITKKLYRDGNISSVDDFARKWGSKMHDVLIDDSKISPPSANGPNKVVLGGLFVGNVGHQVTAKMILFRLPGKDLQASVITFNPSTGFNDFGHADAIIEFEANQTARAKIWHRRLDKLGPDDQILALAKLQRDNDTSGTVGGKIDSVRITPSEINWLTVKKECNNK
jgi:hypothetical protein